MKSLLIKTMTEGAKTSNFAFVLIVLVFPLTLLLAFLVGVTVLVKLARTPPAELRPYASVSLGMTHREFINLCGTGLEGKERDYSMSRGELSSDSRASLEIRESTRERASDGRRCGGSFTFYGDVLDSITR